MRSLMADSNLKAMDLAMLAWTSPAGKGGGGPPPGKGGGGPPAGKGGGGSLAEMLQRLGGGVRGGGQFAGTGQFSMALQGLGSSQGSHPPSIWAEAAASKQPIDTERRPSDDAVLKGAALQAKLCAGPFPPHRRQPVTMIHMAKCGTNFWSTVLHYACEGLPRDMSIAEMVKFELADGPEKQKYMALEQRLDVKPPGVLNNPLAKLDREYNFSLACPYLVPEKRQSWWVVDAEKGASYKAWNYHVSLPDVSFLSRARQQMQAAADAPYVTMVRSPAQRLLSGYHHPLHGVPPEFKKNEKTGEPMGLDAYVGLKKGTQCRVLLGRPCTGVKDAMEAAERMRSMFQFVGLTDFWNESVCLFHRQVGTAPRPQEFEAVRVYHGKDRLSDGWYDATKLQGYTDVADGEVYAAAEAIFTQRLAAELGMSRCEVQRQGKHAELGAARARPSLACK